MLLADFNYELPKELIAQEGIERRDSSRLMVLEKDGSIKNSSFQDLSKLFRPGDLLVLNNARVSKARLLGRKETGGKIDCLLIPEKLGQLPKVTVPISSVQEAYLRPSNVRVGTRLLFTQLVEGKEKVYIAKVVERIAGAKFKLVFEEPEIIDQLGELPIPPYIKKPLPDQERYQTVFSKKSGSLAAPTAGLHFTEPFLKKLEAQGVEIAFLTLHIGIGTFSPIRAEVVEEWKMQPEYYEVSQESAQKINEAIQSKRRIFVVGTTSVRTLESVTHENKVMAGEGWTDIFIYPGYNFKFPYAGMITNFHLPKSTLFLLVCALAGKDKILTAYKEAVEQKYRFYSLGDAMFILR